MSEEPPTNGQRAARALDAVNLYARSSSTEGSPEEIFFFDFERDALPGGDQDRLSALLCGLMHYAERRSLSFFDPLSAARQEYLRQRTAYRPGQAVRRAGPEWRVPAPGDTPLIGEVIAARPGRPAEYHVDFLTCREWLPEPDLLPAQQFPSVATSYGTFASAYIARRCLSRVIARIENDHREDRTPESGVVRDLTTIVDAISGWAGLSRQTLLQSFSEVVTEENGLMIAGPHGPHPVTLAAASVPLPPRASLPESSGPADVDAVVLPLRNPGRRPRTGPSLWPPTRQPMTISPRGRPSENPIPFCCRVVPTTR